MTIERLCVYQNSIPAFCFDIQDNGICEIKISWNQLSGRNYRRFICFTDKEEVFGSTIRLKNLSHNSLPMLLEQNDASGIVYRLKKPK